MSHASKLHIVLDGSFLLNVISAVSQFIRIDALIVFSSSLESFPYSPAEE